MHKKQTIAVCGILLAHELAGATDRVGLFPVFALRRLFIGASSFHFAAFSSSKHEGLAQHCCRAQNLQLAFLCPVGVRRTDEFQRSDNLQPLGREWSSLRLRLFATQELF